MRVDLLHFLRTLRRSPASAAAAILTLALTIGAGTSIFAVVDAALFTPLPFAHPESLVTMGEVPLDDLAAAPRTVQYATFEAWRERAGSQASLEAIDGTNVTLTGLGVAERMSASDVTPGFLALLGIAPARGRAFDSGDVAQPVVIVSDAFWRGKLGSDPAVIGREIVLGGRAHTIVGVLPAAFAFPMEPGELWRPLPLAPADAVRAGYRVRVVARLASVSTAPGLAASLDEVSRTSTPAARVNVTGIEAAIAGDTPRRLALLLAAAALAIVIAFTNLAGLLIVRTIDRRRELAVRTAIGATRFEIGRQVLIEAEALVVMGVAGGALLAWWMTPAVARLALAQSGALAMSRVTLHWPVILVVLVAASICAWVCGLVPAIAASRRSVVDVLRRGTTPPRRERALRRAFVAGQVAAAFVLLVSLALLGRSLFDLVRTTPGFDPRGVIAMQVSLPAVRYAGNTRVAAFYDTLQSALDTRLGNGVASFVDEIPLTGDRGRTLVRGTAADRGHEAVVRAAGPGYFEVMRIQIVAGRSFDRGDDASAPPRVIVGEALAARLGPMGTVVGQRVTLGAATPPVEIVGVAGDVKHRSLDEPRVPTIYLPAAQAPSRSNVIVVRSALPAADIAAAVRHEVARLDPDLPVYSVQPLTDVVAHSPGVPARRVLTTALAGFAMLAVTLGAVGLFGVVAHDVASRRRELALRVALGANTARIVRDTVTSATAIVGAGLAAGALGSIWAARALAGVVVDAGRLDVRTVAVPAIALIFVSVLVVLPAARRAARTDPLIALRSE